MALLRRYHLIVSSCLPYIVMSIIKISNPVSNGKIIYTPNDVIKDATEYNVNHWETVNIYPVLPFKINTFDPETQDIYVSANVHHQNVLAWDPFVWGKIVFILHVGDMDYVPEQRVMVDVGAYLGYYSLAAASMGTKVIAIEPMSRNAHKFAESIIANHFEDQITLYQNAAWDTVSDQLEPSNGQITTTFAKSEKTLGLIYGVDFVNATTLSEIVDEKIVDIMKINTEGTEAHVIVGARGLICNHTVRHIIMDFSQEIRTKNTEVENMLHFLQAVGYVVSDIIPSSPQLNIGDYKDFPPILFFTLMDKKRTDACF